MNKPTVVVVVGPTASGKTALAVELAKRLNGEIISADSMQIYKKMNIATAKPTSEEMQGIPHHLIDFVDPGSEFSVAEYKKVAMTAISDILSRNKLPIVAGGTGLYIDTLIKNTEYADYEDKSMQIRFYLDKLYYEKGIEYLYELLRQADAPTAERLHINDKKRIIRALEVYMITGKTMSEHISSSHLYESEYRWCIIGITAEDRQYLYDRINRRVDIMIEKGLIDEARDFYADAHSSTAKQAIGYKELKPYLDGEISLEQAAEKLKMETRRYAKRQLTWFRRNKQISWLMADKLTSQELIEGSVKIIEEFRG